VLFLTALGVFTITPSSGRWARPATYYFLSNSTWPFGIPACCFSWRHDRNNIIRSTGDTLTPSLLMLGSMAVNTALDRFLFSGGPRSAHGNRRRGNRLGHKPRLRARGTIWVIHSGKNC